MTQPHGGGHLVCRSLPDSSPNTRGHGHLVKLAAHRHGRLPNMGRYHFDLDGLHSRGPLAGRLPNGAQEVQRASLLELLVHHTLAKKHVREKMGGLFVLLFQKCLALMYEIRQCR